LVKHSPDFTLKTANRVSDSLKENPEFPDLKPTQAELEKVCQEFTVSISKAGRNDRTLLSAKNDKKAELIRILDEMADYVTATSKNDTTMLLRSGFDIVGIRIAEQTLEPIEKFNVEIGGPGVATTSVKRVKGAKAYIHKCTLDPITPDSIWITETTTDRENTFTNLRSVSRYWFQVIAIGRGKQLETSLPVSIVIQ